MNKKIIISLAVIGVAASVVIGGTIAYFTDTEVSAGNIFTAGSIDLKIDHTKQTYNGVDCKTCSVILVSDTSNDVVATIGGADPVQMPHPAVPVTFIHPAWTASIPGANWIWATDPTLPSDATTGPIYTFQKKFDWWGPISGVSLTLNVGADNSYEVWLNNVKIAGDNTEQNYNASGQDQYNNGVILTNIKQGQNIIEFKVKNWAPNGWQGTPTTNPGGLLYKLVIDGNCQNDYFKNQCRLWGWKDLVEGDTFFNFDDIKPGDWGTNVISYHVYNNDARVCFIVDNIEGKLADGLNFVMWKDDGYGQYNGQEIFGPAPLTPEKVAIALGEVEGSTDNYIGVFWCAGNITGVDENDLKCDGSTMGNEYQATKMTADLIFYAIQARHTEDLNCSEVNWKEDLN